MSNALRLIKLKRISVDRDNETSTASQEYALEAFIQRTGATVVADFTEYGKSAFHHIARPMLDEALQMISNGMADGLIVWKLDRFCRKGAAEVFRMISLIKSGNGFLIATEDDIDTRRNGMGDVIKVCVIAELAKGESEAKSQRTKDWHRNRLRGGRDGKLPMIPSGPRPFGYDRFTPNALTVNEKEATLIREAASSLMAGKSLRGIARTFHERGIQSPRGKAWSHDTLRNVLRSPTQAGKREIAGAMVDGDWDAILDEPTWKACRAILADPKRNNRVGISSERKHYLSSLMTCGKEACQGIMRSGGSANGKHIRYECAKCQSVSIYAKETDDFVGATLMALLDDAAWAELKSRGRKADTAAIARLAKAMDHERAKWLDGKISDEAWDAAQRDITERAEKLEAKDAVNVPSVESIRASWETMRPDDKRLTVIAAVESIIIAPGSSKFRGTARITINLAN